MLAKKNLLTIIISTALIVRLIYLFGFVDLKNDNYWEYGDIAENIINERGYSLFYFENDTLRQAYNPHIQPFPSAFMSPLYVYYLVPFFYLQNSEQRNIALIISQIFLSLLVIYFIFNLTNVLFGFNAALISSLIVSFVPENIYLTSVHNSVVLYHLFVVMLLYYIVTKNIIENKYGLIIFSVLCSLLVYLRSEFLLFLILSLSFLLLKKKIKMVLVSIFIFSILLTPWIIRNEIVFDKFIPLTTSFGLNLYRGNNPVGIGNWGEEKFIIEIRKLSSGNNFEIIYNQYYTEKAISFISNNPSKVLSYAFQKIISLWIIDFNDPKSTNFFYFIPSIILMLISVLGIIQSFNPDKFRFFYLLLFSTTVVSIIFFPLPRYQIMMKIILIPFCAFYVNHIISIFIKFNTKNR